MRWPASCTYTGTMMRWALALMFLAGCAVDPIDPLQETSSAAHIAQPEVVAIDFLGATKTTAACSGTLLAPRVVLTAAHCASKAQRGFVHAPDAHVKSSAVAAVRLFDWTGDATTEHDVALVVLVNDMTLDEYPKLWSHDADGRTATQAHRTNSAAMYAAIASSKVTIAKSQSALTLYVPKAADDAGGPLFGSDSSGRHAVMGMMMGHGADSNGGYAARLTDSRLRSWIASVIASPDTAPTADTATSSTEDLETLAGDDDADLGATNAEVPDAPDDDEAIVEPLGPNGSSDLDAAEKKMASKSPAMTVTSLNARSGH